jgi:hypothetical protein
VKLSGNVYGSWTAEALQRRDGEVSGKAVLNGCREWAEASAALNEVSGDGQLCWKEVTEAEDVRANRLSLSMLDERRG